MIHPQPVVVAVVDAASPAFRRRRKAIELLNEMHGANLYEDRC